MEVNVHTKRYRVEPSGDLKLSDRDPADTSGFDGSEELALEESAKIDQKLDNLQEKLFAQHEHKVLVVLQGMDTAGKDGTIRRLFRGMNPSGVIVAHFREPTPEELDHDFLWRIHARVPGKGEIVIFNRSHYESVLVERVHNILPKEVWKRRYGEIRDFEKMLAEEGTYILKFFLHISKDEQKRRLDERLKDPNKGWKFSKDDISERKLWKEYTKAYEDALGETSTEYAPWYVVPANNKWFRDLLVAAVLAKTIEGLDLKYPGLPTEFKSTKIS